MNVGIVGIVIPFPGIHKFNFWHISLLTQPVGMALNVKDAKIILFSSRDGVHFTQEKETCRQDQFRPITVVIIDSTTE